LVSADPIEKKLTATKEEYEKAVAKARDDLLVNLKKKEEAAQKVSDLKTLEKVQAEAKAFEDGGELPRSVPVKGYEGQLRTAQAKLEEAYGVAVKEYTKGGKIELAKAVQQEFDEVKKGGGAAAIPAGPFQTKSVWVADSPRMVLTVTERKGDTFRAAFKIGDKIERNVSGTFKDGKLSWLAKDVRMVLGGPGGDNHGTVASDLAGDKIDFVWRGDNGASGTFTLRLVKGK